MRILFILWIFLPSLLLSNTLIHGRVMDAQTQEPLPFTNIFISGTTFGAAANDSGSYEFIAPPGAYELVFSRIGYKPVIKTISLGANAFLRVDAELEVNPLQTEEIQVTAASTARFQQNLKLFQKKFLGESMNALQCSIENTDVFNFTDEKNYLTATAIAPIIIKNNALGYLIRVELDTFYLNKTNENCYYNIFSYFQELPPPNRMTQKVWLQNRNRIFRTSSKYFLRQLLRLQHYDNALYEFELISFAVEKGKLQPLFFMQPGELHVQNIYPELNIYRWRWIKDSVVRIEARGNRSYVQFLAPYIDFDKHGNFINPGQFQLNGYWATQRIAELLPLDFEIQRMEYSRRRSFD